MAGPIYKLWMLKFTEAWYQLSEEEQNNRLAKIEETLQKAGGKRIITCSSAWSSEEWQGFGVEDFPDIEAVQKHTEALMELDHYRYMESKSLLGTQWES
jgi:NAD(P)H-dependent flavin oxidoreductase YrpB (nitropropane dioxygenase family)